MHHCLRGQPRDPSSSEIKYIDVRHHFLRELVDSSNIYIAYVKLVNQHADMTTKPLPSESFFSHKNVLLKAK